MFGFVPPHLMLPVGLLIIILWVMLVHNFRRSPTMQKFVAETIGDDTPESALRTFELAKQRLINHLRDNNLDHNIRQRIETALDETSARPSD